MGTVIICVILAVIVVYTIYSYRKKLASGCCGSGGDKERVVKPKDTDAAHYPCEKQIDVEGMTCKNCAARVANAFNQKEGCYAQVNLEKKLLTLHTMEPMEDGEIRSVVALAGYMAREIRSVK